MKQAGELAVLRALWWYSPERPVPGDVLRTGTGRRYMVLEVRDQANGRPEMHCVVLTPRAGVPGLEDPPTLTGRVWHWSWAKRGQRQRLRLAQQARRLAREQGITFGQAIEAYRKRRF